MKSCGSVETIVNGFIMANDQVVTREMNIAEAIEAGATALFDEKYGDSVRVVRVGDVSMELCGGTHVRAAGDIGLFKIVSEAGIAAGVRRIEALTGFGALDFVRQMEDEQRGIAALLKAEAGNSRDRLEKLLARQRELQREIETLQAKLNVAASGDLLSQAVEVQGVKLLAVQVQVEDIKALRDLSDTLKDRIGEGVIVLGAAIGGKANLLVAVTKGLSGTIKAGDIIKQIAPIVGGSGGGKPELAQAGGSQPEKLDEALGGSCCNPCGALNEAVNNPGVHMSASLAHNNGHYSHTQKATILVVDDEVIIRELCVQALQEYRVLQAGTCEEALRLYKRTHVDLILSDMMMPGGSGLDLLKQVKTLDPNAAVIIMTGFVDKEIILNALKEDADDFINKPLNLLQLKTSIEKALGRKALKEELANIKRSDELKNAFLSLVSHKLRTPITGISLFLQNLRMGVFNPDDQTCQQNIALANEEARYLGQLVADLLAFSQVMVHGTGVNKSPCDLNEIVAEVVLKCREVHCKFDI